MKSDSPEARMYKRAEMLKWTVGIIVAIFLGGFTVAGYFGQYETKASAEDHQQKHADEHDEVESKLKANADRLIKVRIYQARHEERSELIDRRLELLLERTEEQPRTPSIRRARAIREARLEREIAVQEARVEAVEDDPTAGLDEEELK